MPPKKKFKSNKRVADNDEDESVVDSGDEEVVKSAEPEPGSAFKDKDGTSGWVLGKRRRIQVKKYGGKPYVDIREYYEKDGKLLPGKKGISLTPEQYKVVVSLQGEIDEVLEAEKK